jgi:hypothetical protein
MVPILDKVALSNLNQLDRGQDRTALLQHGDGQPPIAAVLLSGVEGSVEIVAPAIAATDLVQGHRLDASVVAMAHGALRFYFAQVEEPLALSGQDRP